MNYPVITGIFCVYITAIDNAVVSMETSFPAADYVSEWVTIKSQAGAESETKFTHGLGQVPAFVDIQVKSTEAPNMGFIFPGIVTDAEPGWPGVLSSAQRDDDWSGEYGGVVYVYNNVSILVTVPNKANGVTTGSVIYTGGSPYWTGENNQTSSTALVRARAWLKETFPNPDFSINGLKIKAKNKNDSVTFVDTEHGLGATPSFVIARVHLNHADGWVSDTQGSNMVSMGTEDQYASHCITICGYNNYSVRVWTSSRDRSGGIFYNGDGWGDGSISTIYSDSGELEIMAWLLLGTPVLQTDVSIGDMNIFGMDSAEEKFEIEFEISLPCLAAEDHILSVVVEVADGPNEGYRFPGAGSGMVNTQRPGNPCSYGGLVFAYSSDSIRLWRPLDTTGSILCIGEYMGNGSYSQAARSAKVFITVWASEIKLGNAPLSRAAPNTCLHFIQSGSGLTACHASLEESHGASFTKCIELCRANENCNSFSFGPGICTTYNIEGNLYLTTLEGVSVWYLE